MDPLHSPENINTYFIEQIKDYAIFATDTKGIITTWNKGCERIKGYKEEEALGSFMACCTRMNISKQVDPSRN
jgi:PAS domain S-box-containing protein